MQNHLLLLQFPLSTLVCSHAETVSLNPQEGLAAQLQEAQNDYMKPLGASLLPGSLCPCNSGGGTVPGRQGDQGQGCQSLLGNQEEKRLFQAIKAPVGSGRRGAHRRLPRWPPVHRLKGGAMPERKWG